LISLPACSGQPKTLPPPAVATPLAPPAAITFLAPAPYPTFTPLAGPGATATLPPLPSSTPAPTSASLIPTLAALTGFVSQPPDPGLASLAANEIGANLPTQIRIAAIGVDSAVVPVGWHLEGEAAIYDSPGYAAGFLVSSAPPGTVGNTVIYGHNNILGEVFRRLNELKAGDLVEVSTSLGEVFRRLNELKAGDLVEVSTRAQVWHYTVESVTTFQEAGIVPEQQAANLAYFDPTSDVRLTLLTCWPYTGNRHRVAVVAKPAP
ncbi:MAG: sortase, partial [Chloroflexi bacterium]|nr:sortase [Chloroflexota bacterium]